ncbi:hypothetical protein [Aquiflexum balticum]|nr:hypothetical protein [Aquiflexum balticum]
MNASEIKYLEGKLAEKPFRWEELYFEILDHVLCKYEASEIDEVGAFWEQENLNWSRWKIFKIKFRHRNLLTLEYLKYFLKSISSLHLKDLMANGIFLTIATIFGYFLPNQKLIILIMFLSLVCLPICFFAWIYHTKDTIGERSPSLKGKGLYSGKRDAFNELIVGNLFCWGIFLFSIQKLQGFEGIFDVLFAMPHTTTLIFFLLLIANRALFKVYQAKLKPYLYEAK